MPAMTDEQFEALLPQQPTAAAQAASRGMTDDEFNALLPQQAQPEQTWGEWAIGVPGRVAGSMVQAVQDTIGGAEAEGHRMMGEFGEMITEDYPRIMREQLGLAGTHYRTLAHGLGLADAPAPADETAYRNAVADMLLTTGGGALGRSIGTHVGDAAKYLGRGFRSVPGAERFLAREAGHITSGAPSAGLSDLIAPTVSGAAVGTVVDMLDPTAWELTDKPVAGGAGLAAAAAVGRNTIDDLLLGNPRWRALMMGPSKGRVSMVIGAALGHMTAQGVQVTAEQISALVDEVARKLEGEQFGPPAPTRYNPGAVFEMPALGETRHY